MVDIKNNNKPNEASAEPTTKSVLGIELEELDVLLSEQCLQARNALEGWFEKCKNIHINVG